MLFKVREGRLRRDLLWSHAKARTSLNIYDTLMNPIPEIGNCLIYSTDVRHINRHIPIPG